ncbi:ABC transporter ATP-binding protein/permease [Patescibacteria group bacterium]|nr:ABC transporter ATP-binding protein/permease [Patescibacteria group bacterium]
MKKSFVWLVIFSAIGNIIWLLQPIVIGRIFNTIQFASQKNQIRLIAYSVGLLVVLNVAGWIFHSLSRVLENRNAFLVRKNYRQTMFEQAMDLPTTWHKDHHSGDTIDKINKASDRLFEFSSELFIIMQNVIGLVASVIILSFYDVKPLIIVLFASVAAVVVIIKFDKKLLKNYRIIYKAENFIASGIYDYISNYFTIISLRLKQRAAKEMNARSLNPFSIFVANSKLNEIKWFLSSFIMSLMMAGVLLFNAYNTYKAQGVILIGTLFVLYQYLYNIEHVFYTFAWKYSDTVRQNAAVVAAEVIRNEYEKLHLENKYALPDNWKVIQIKKLFFSYKEEGGEKNEKYTLDDVSLKIERRKKIALIGVSGSGKSTVLSLLRGMHDADSGSVYCDGKKLKKGLKHLHEYATLIPQEPEIFNESIEYNITLGVHVGRKQLAEVIRLANLSDLISRLKNGLKTSVLEKGVSLSGGEKQRLALARGLLAAKDSQFLLLDEPTSSVDVENEMQIYQNIFVAFNNKTIISAVHSLHLLRYFDYVYMFKDSRLIAEGNFSMLLEDENFKTLWESYDRENKKEG